MARIKKSPPDLKQVDILSDYTALVTEVGKILEVSRRDFVKSTNLIMTTTYWLIGQRIVEYEQQGQLRAEYGETLIQQLALDLTQKFGRGFSKRNVEQMRRFYLLWPSVQKASELTEDRDETQIAQTLSAQSWASSAPKFFLPWSHYVRLMSVDSPKARAFYEEEALRGGWSIRQLHRQIGTQFYERTLLSKDKASMLRKGAIQKAEDMVSIEEEIKDPLLLEFTGLKDEYSENDLEEALVANMEKFLLELGDGFAFIGRQRRLRIGNKWYRIDLLLFHRKLRALVIIDLKLEEFTHADLGQMHLYLNYAKKHWIMEGENPPIGLILCSEKDTDLAQYAFESLTNKIIAAEYKTILPSEKVLTEHLQKIRRQLEFRSIIKKHHSE